MNLLLEIYEIIFAYWTLHILLCLFTFLTSFLGDWGKDVRQWSFSKAMQSASIALERWTGATKEIFYESLNQGKSPLTILEVAIGRGATFKYYPKTRPCSLLAVEPDKTCEKEIRQTLKKHKNIHLQNFYAISAEDMSPIADGSVDIVLTTEGLCSIPNTLKTLQEIRRVLKPGGKYYFFEHILHEPGTTWRKIQDLLLWTHVWPYVAHGCRFFGNPEILTNFNGFTSCHGTISNFVNSKNWLNPFNIVAPHYYGIATK